MVLDQLPESLMHGGFIAPTIDYIDQARNSFKHSGGSEMPVLSIVNVTTPGFAPDDHYVIDVLAHNFENTTDADGSNNHSKILATVQAFIKAYPGVESHILHSAYRPMNSHDGYPNFVGTMPLLQLFRIFFRHHAISYDTPQDNLLMAGYGIEACAHAHIHNGGVRVANLLQSLENDGK